MSFLSETEWLNKQQQTDAHLCVLIDCPISSVSLLHVCLFIVSSSFALLICFPFVF